MKGKFIIEIGKEVTEQKLIEQCFNLFYSGYEYKYLLFFYALAKRWHLSKLIYYSNLIK